MAVEKEVIEEIKKELSNLVIIEKYAEKKKTYKAMIEKFYDLIKMGFEEKEVRECPVHFRFFDNPEQYIHTLPLRHFITNIMMWEPLIQLGFFNEINANYIADCTRLSAGYLKGYVDEMIVKPFSKRCENVKMNKACHDMIHNLGRISNDFNMILGLSINVETFIDVAKRNPRFNEIIRTKIAEGMQPNEIESYLNDLVDEEIEILKNEDNLIRPILRSGTGIKSGQFKEFAVNGGMAPDLDGVTIPIPINSNFLVGGLNSVTNYYIDALKGRKSVIMNKTVMGRSGHFARMVMLSVSDIKLSKKVDDCYTLHPIEYTIRTKEHLFRMKGRNYRLPWQRNYRIMTGNEMHLIGEKILVRSPITCASKKICKKCYGDLFYTNKDIRSVGGYSGALITEPLSQRVLSAKHLLTTQSDKLTFNEEFYDALSIHANEIMINNENEKIDKGIYSLVLIKENLQVIDEFEESEFNSYVTLFHIKNKETGELIEMAEVDGKEMYISPELREIISKDKTTKDWYEINLAKFNDDDRIFVAEISNRELTKPLYSIMHLLNHSDHEKCETINEMTQKLLDLLIESQIDADAVHGEMLIRPLIRSSIDVLQRPNFKRYEGGHEYVILTVDGALQRHPSVLVSLSFQHLGRQLQNPLTFKKTAPSFIDPFYREKP